MLPPSHPLTLLSLRQFSGGLPLFFPLRSLSQRQFSGLLPSASSIASSGGEPGDVPSLISGLVLTQSPSTAPSSLASALSSSFPSLSFTPSLIESVLKLLWNDGPRSVLFFRSLLLLPCPLSPSSFDLALDVAARLRDSCSLRSILLARRAARTPFSHRTFSILAERLTNSGKPDRAVRLFLSLHRHGCPQTLPIFNSLLDVLCKSRRVRKAASLFRSLRSRFGADSTTFNILAHGWCLVNSTSAALQVLQDMLHSGLRPTLVTFNILLKGYFRAGQVRHGWEFFLQMKKRGRRRGSGCTPDVVSYTTVVHGLGIAGQIDDACKLFDEMISQGILPSIATYNALMQVLCKKDCVRNALSLFDKMLGRGYSPNATTYNVVIKGLCHGRDTGRAMEFVERMRGDGCGPNTQTYNIVIRHLCEEGEVEKALEMLERMKEGRDCLPNLDTYNVLISGMFARRRSEDMAVAGRMVAEMAERGHFPRRFMFNKVLNGLFLTGNQDFSRQLLRMQDRFRRLRREIRL